MNPDAIYNSVQYEIYHVAMLVICTTWTSCMQANPEHVNDKRTVITLGLSLQLWGLSLSVSFCLSLSQWPSLHCAFRSQLYTLPQSIRGPSEPEAPPTVHRGARAACPSDRTRTFPTRPASFVMHRCLGQFDLKISFPPLFFYSQIRAAHHNANGRAHLNKAREALCVWEPLFLISASGINQYPGRVSVVAFSENRFNASLSSKAPYKIRVTSEAVKLLEEKKETH